MTIQSYLIYPEAGGGPALAENLRRTTGCSEVIPAENRELLVLVTETENGEEQKRLEESLQELEGVACLAMVGGWTE
jgi:nitrate reductase NapAB chaperone NapD